MVRDRRTQLRGPGHCCRSCALFVRPTMLLRLDCLLLTLPRHSPTVTLPQTENFGEAAGGGRERGWSTGSYVAPEDGELHLVLDNTQSVSQSAADRSSAGGTRARSLHLHLVVLPLHSYMYCCWSNSWLHLDSRACFCFLYSGSRHGWWSACLAWPLSRQVRALAKLGHVHLASFNLRRRPAVDTHFG